MRGAPPVEIRVRRQGSWRAFVVALVALTAASIGLWLASAEIGAAAKVILAASTLLAGAGALSTTTPFDLSLRWTGSSWALSAELRGYRSLLPER
jgi:archaellum biogenesis protein FlaJ (TadC family)